MFNPFRSLIRILGICDKELLEVARQPAFILAVVLGPFLILLLFGVGYRTERKPLRTLFVTAKNDPISNDIYRFLPELGPQLNFQGITNDAESAKRMLQRRIVDVVVFAPANSAETIGKNQQAVFTLLHNAMDPEKSDYIRLTGEIFVNKLNNQLLNSVVASERKQLQVDVEAAIETVRHLRDSLERSDRATALQAQTDLNNILDRIGHSIRSRIESSDGSQSADVREILTNMAEVHSMLNPSLVPEQEKRNYAPEIQRSVNVENNLIVLGTQLGKLKELDAQLMLAPFSSKTEPIGKAQPRIAEYFSPAILILLLQHLAIILASVSLVREFTSRNLELLEASPLRPFEMLLGKYAASLLLSGFAAALLTVLLVFGLRVPMMGEWPQYIAIIAVLLFASLALGFLISAFASSQEYAILGTMLLFIASIFFTGFFLDLNMLWRPLQIISYALPATYGIRLVQDVMLRGDPVGIVYLEFLVMLGLCFTLCASILSRRKFRT